MSKTKENDAVGVTITPPNFQIVAITVEGNAPYVQHKFSQKAQLQMIAKHKLGSQAKSKAKKEPRDFDADYTGAMHISEDGWIGIPATSFKNAMVSACRSAGFVMTKAKQGILHVIADGYDPIEGTPLVQIIGEPEQHTTYARNETGVADIRCRPMWKEWSAVVNVQYDADMFSATDVVNLLSRAGMQVGIGEGRPDSKKSNGCGWGTFTIRSN